MPAPTAALPAICTSDNLAKYAVAGEPTILFLLTDVGSTADYQFRDKTGGRSFLLKWNTRLDGHVLRVPYSVWSAKDHAFANALMRQPMHRPVVVLVEFAASAPAVTAPAEAESQSPEKTGAPETQEAACIVVGPSVAPQAGAPTGEAEGTAEQIVAAIVPLHMRAYVAAEAPIRVKPLAELLNVTPEVLREAIANPHSRLEIAAAGWVKRTA